MPPLDVQLAIYNQAWALLEANGSTFSSLVLPGNRLKMTAVRTDEVDTIKTGANDFPKVRVEMGDGSDSGKEPVVFGQNSPAFSSAVCDYGVPMKHTLMIKIVHDSTVLSKQTPVEAAVIGALKAKGRTMGLSYVSASKFLGISRREEVGKDIGTTKRVVSRIRFEISCSPKLSQLTAT